MTTTRTVTSSATSLPRLARHRTLAIPSASSVAGAAKAGSIPLRSTPLLRRPLPACDQCRKSKCKCERAVDGDACKSCIMLGTREFILSPISCPHRSPMPSEPTLVARLSPARVLRRYALHSIPVALHRIYRHVSMTPPARSWPTLHHPFQTYFTSSIPKYHLIMILMLWSNWPPMLPTPSLRPHSPHLVYHLS